MPRRHQRPTPCYLAAASRWASPLGSGRPPWCFRLWTPARDTHIQPGKRSVCERRLSSWASCSKIDQPPPPPMINKQIQRTYGMQTGCRRAGSWEASSFWMLLLLDLKHKRTNQIKGACDITTRGPITNRQLEEFIIFIICLIQLALHYLFLTNQMNQTS